MNNWSKATLDLLILQYRDLPNASAEITAMLDGFDNIYEFFDSFIGKFDLDNAIGHRLDLIGKIVGVNRIVPDVILKTFFGFSANSNALGFNSAPFYRYEFSKYNDLVLDDQQFLLFIKAKIVKNNTNATLPDIQKSINFLIGDSGYVVDNKNMSMSLYLENNNINISTMVSIIKQDIIITPQGVEIFSIEYRPETFGFSRNPNALGFGSGQFAQYLTQ